MIGTLLIMIILIAVLGLVVVNAMKHSPWATFHRVCHAADCGAGWFVSAQHPTRPRA
jgi:carbon starvation protein CstA